MDTKVDWNAAVARDLADYEKKTSGFSSEKKEFDKTKYFSLALAQNEKSGDRRLRILPIDNEGNWYASVKFHNLKVGQTWRKLYDPAQDNEPSPLNEMYEYLTKTGEKEDKELAKSYKSRDFYIVRGIERGKEHEGIKFWRFNRVYDGSGIMDKIIPILKNKGAFYRPDELGRDLIISVVKDLTKGYTKVSSIMPDDPAPVSLDQTQVDEWLNDPLTWNEVYKKKPLEYLTIVAQGSEPVWDTDKKQFIAKVDDIGVGNVINSQQSVQNKLEVPTSVSPDEPYEIEVEETSVDDLPF